MEQDRAPAVLPHHSQLARKAADQPQVVVNTIAATRTRTGLRVRAELDTSAYPPACLSVSNVAAPLPIQPHEHRGAWNYSITPSAQDGRQPAPLPDHAQLRAMACKPLATPHSLDDVQPRWTPWPAP